MKPLSSPKHCRHPLWLPCLPLSHSLPCPPISPAAGRRRKSRFTHKHLAQLGNSSTTCPLRVIAHLDLDAFYAQCEGVRLGIAEDQPLAVQVSPNQAQE